MTDKHILISGLNPAWQKTLFFHSFRPGEINRAEVAERFFIHPDYLSHIFRDWAGITFQDYVIKMRIDKAKKMLIYTDAPISNIADQAGYSNTAYFAKHFKRETGMTPKEYRHSARTLGKYS